ncbi:MAG TPA: TonB-dependent receptor, partial [Caulobacter sp.]|nr:TonB-dependent receptor [Caulobacter sp.]
MTVTFRRALMLGAAALCLSSAAQAAEADQTHLDSVLVTARPDPEDPPAVAQARKRLSETPGAVAVISSEAYARRFALGLNDTVRDVPGVFAQKKFGE